MTDHEAVALAVFGYPRRRLLAALVRTCLGRPLPDVDTLAERFAAGPTRVRLTLRLSALGWLIDRPRLRTSTAQQRRLGSRRTRKGPS